MKATEMVEKKEEMFLEILSALKKHVNTVKWICAGDEEDSFCCFNDLVEASKDSDVIIKKWEDFVLSLSDDKGEREDKVIDMTKLTRIQEDNICYAIGEWYLEWKDKIVNFDNRTHNLGFAKEKLKEMICGDGDE